jgi:hypothetical protein
MSNRLRLILPVFYIHIKYITQYMIIIKFNSKTQPPVGRVLE